MKQTLLEMYEGLSGSSCIAVYKVVCKGDSFWRSGFESQFGLVWCDATARGRQDAGRAGVIITLGNVILVREAGGEDNW